MSHSNNDQGILRVIQSIASNRESGELEIISSRNLGTLRFRKGKLVDATLGMQSLNDQATRVEFTGRITGAEITQKAAIDSAELQAISTIISRMGAKLAQDIEKGMEMRY